MGYKVFLTEIQGIDKNNKNIVIAGPRIIANTILQAEQVLMGGIEEGDIPVNCYIVGELKGEFDVPDNPEIMP